MVRHGSPPCHPRPLGPVVKLPPSARRAAAAAMDTPAPPRFLPEYDNLLLSHADRTRVVPAGLQGRSRQGNQAHRTLLVDGFLAGVWKPVDGTLVIAPFGVLTKAQRQEVTAEGERMLAVMHPGAAHDIRFGTVVPR
ncbi:crosslink repair DNA glycosylase YcaQ family protein [Streptomyces sp. NPDC004533]|uniref:DNA glycosylase AlkZ-like family protein n=1 Tax=Streptomyces sp. NPDC004533 TaxID=3154278 RepID=UPI0033B6A1DB